MASRVEVEDCDCGYIDANDPTESIFSNLLVVNFTSATSEELDDLFITATYEVIQDDAPYTRSFSTDQVQLSSAGLDLTVSPSADGRTVPCAQIFSRTTTFWYGSYRARILVGDVPGTVTAFFNYKNDTQEVDIEFLSAWEDPTLLYSVKPQIYSDSGNPSSSTYQRQKWSDASSSFDRDFHEWSFLWLPDVVHYGIDANYARNISTNVPQAPGRIALSHWSNGDPDYSLGPPTENSTVTVSFLQVVYNDTNAAELVCRKTTSACSILDGILQDSSNLGGEASDAPSLIQQTNSSRHQAMSPTAAPGWLSLLILLYYLL